MAPSPARTSVKSRRTRSRGETCARRTWLRGAVREPAPGAGGVVDHSRLHHDRCVRHRALRTPDPRVRRIQEAGEVTRGCVSRAAGAANERQMGGACRGPGALGGPLRRCIHRSSAASSSERPPAPRRAGAISQTRSAPTVWARSSALERWPAAASSPAGSGRTPAAPGPRAGRPAAPGSLPRPRPRASRIRARGRGARLHPPHRCHGQPQGHARDRRRTRSDRPDLLEQGVEDARGNRRVEGIFGCGQRHELYRYSAGQCIASSR